MYRASQSAAATKPPPSPGRTGALVADGAARPKLAGLTIVLPCFNEAANVGAAIINATAAAERCALIHEIVVVDDGSSDETASLAAQFARRDARVRLVVHAGNAGYGQAVRTGITAAQLPWVLLTDADLQFDLTELETFLATAAHADVVWGERIDRQDPLIRRVNAAAWNWLVRRTFGLPVRDIDCAFKLVRRETLNRCELRSSGAMISTELAVQCYAAGARIAQLAVHHRPRTHGESSGANPRVVARAFRELVTLRRQLGAAHA